MADGGAVWRLQGATVVVDPGHAVPGAAIHVAAPAADDSGAGHVLEHMVFRDPAAGEGGDLYAALMSAGPRHDLNAATLATHTTYHLASATAKGRDVMLLRMLRAILHPALDAAHLAQERAIVASEMAGFWADPQAAALEGLRALACPGQRAAQGGLPDAVRWLDVADLRALHRRHYRAAGMLLHITGPAPDPAVWQALEAILRDSPAAPQGGPDGQALPQALPIDLPADSGLPGLAWLLPGFGPRAVEVLRGAVETLLPGARARGGVDSGPGELRLAGPVQSLADAGDWLARARHILGGPDLVPVLRAGARQALLTGVTLADRRAALVQAWQARTDLATALAADETALLMTWAAAGPDVPTGLADLMQGPVVAHVFQSGTVLPQVAAGAPPIPIAAPRGRVRAVAPRLVALSLADLPQADLPTAGALLRGLAARDGARVVPLTPGPRVALVTLPETGDPLKSHAPALAGVPAFPLHLRIERQLWAALTVAGAGLVALEGVADPAAADRIWRDLSAGYLDPDPTAPAAARRTIPLGQVDIPVQGTLSTLGLGLALGPEPLLPLIAHALEWHWLRQAVRRDGGAYGVRCRVGPGGALVFLAARDPAPAEVTLARFAASGDWLRQNLRGDLLAGAIRGTLERLAPLPAPDWERQVAEWRARLEPLQAPDHLRAAIAGATAVQVVAVADRLDQAMSRATSLTYRASG